MFIVHVRNINFQEILKWQETVPGPEMKHFISMLGHTIQLYLSWDLNDQNVFKILRYLASGFHKVFKTENKLVSSTSFRAK